MSKSVGAKGRWSPCSQLLIDVREMKNLSWPSSFRKVAVYKSLKAGEIFRYDQAMVILAVWLCNLVKFG